jgi:aspartate/methionine/tyrosine aminotransferase
VRREPAGPDFPALDGPADDAATAGAAGDAARAVLLAVPPDPDAADRPDAPPVAADGILPADGTFALATFLARWTACARYDLAASDSQALPLAALLRLAGPEDVARWRDLGLGYADPRGAPWLRAAIAARHAGLSADDVLACAGTQEAVTCAARALLGAGDHAVVVTPIYQPAELAVTSLCAATGVPLDPARGWRLDLDRLAAAIRPDTRVVLVNFPNSPTGAAVEPATLDGLVALCRRRGLWLVNDEVYRQTGAADPAPPVVDLYERGVSINSLSKGFGLPGLRVGWAACRDRGALARMLAAKGTLSSCLSGPSEVLAHVALSAEARILRWTRAIGRRNRRRLRALTDRHPALFEADAPENLAFAFPRFRGREGAEGFALRVAAEAGLLVLHSGLWRSALAPVPTDRLRIGLGHAGSAAALATLDAYLGARAGR